MKASFFDGSDEEMNEICERGTRQVRVQVYVLLKMTRSTVLHIRFISESNRALLLPGHKSSARCFVDTVQKLNENEKYETSYSPILRSNLTIHRMPSFGYEEQAILSKAAGGC